MSALWHVLHRPTRKTLCGQPNDGTKPKQGDPCPTCAETLYGMFGEVLDEHEALADLTQRQKEAIRELSSELVEVAQRSPQALTLLQLEAVVAERDALTARLAAVEALADGTTTNQQEADQ